jgi:hypothetical protein
MSKQREHGRFNYKIICIVAMSLVLSVVATPKAHAAAVFADSTCDSTYYDALEARAWLEAQREITQNQNLIFKPDSVLEYTCFESHLNQVADAADDLFSGDTRWGSAQNMASALGSIAGAHKTYDENNFEHDYLGGRSSEADTTPSSSVSKSSYECDVMKKVWESAKCMDFLADASHDGFFTFAEYAAESEDKRFLPEQCTGFTAKTEFENNIEAVYSDDVTKTPWDEDPVQTYFYLFNRGDSGGETTICGNTAGEFNKSKIKTGLKIKRDIGAVTEYNEYVCLVPGCYYNPTSFDDGTCKLPD